MNNISQNIDALSKKAENRYSIGSKYYDIYNVKKVLETQTVPVLWQASQI